MPASAASPANSSLARQTREGFVAYLDGVLDPLADAIRTRLLEKVDASTNARESQDRRDALMDFERFRKPWVEGIRQAWLRQATAAAIPKQRTSRLDSIGLELIGDDVVENKILASRLSMAVEEKAVWELGDLKLRIQHLDGVDELAATDVLRPEAVSQTLVDQWNGVGLSRLSWLLVQDVIQTRMVERMQEAYRRANEFLMQQGVLREIDLSARLKRSADTRGKAPDASPLASAAASLATALDSASGTPLGRARQKASGVLGQLKRLLTDQIAGYDPQRQNKPSPALAEALTEHATQLQTQIIGRMGPASGNFALHEGGVSVQQVAGDLRNRVADLKRKATSSNEKATIEIVALMFQSILAEERIPPAVRVWFARLQMPVLRVALAEPEFFGSLQHPARQLIDRMGACVLGFDASSIDGSALETEIRRVVQVIEQYPETGRRVFQLVYEEFQKFLARYLTGRESTQKLVSLAQQVEQKETLAIQYTIELRRMLSDVPVRDEIREFLFKVWAEVLAVAAIKNGPQHAETVLLKKSAADLVWAASAKPNRTERAKVIQDLPKLLLQLRQGMNLLGIQGDTQEAHIKIIGDTLADAFMSKTEAISSALIEDMAKRLANLEDFISNDSSAEVPLDKESLELALGIDASTIEIVSEGGTQPGDAMLAWARELQVGTWFALDHNGAVNQVQYAWRSERGQLHLFAAPDGRSYLLPLRRLAAYLQAGLLSPTEEEALTVRATRDALAKLDANPERLLGS